MVEAMKKSFSWNHSQISTKSAILLKMRIYIPTQILYESIIGTAMKIHWLHWNAKLSANITAEHNHHWIILPHHIFFRLFFSTKKKTDYREFHFKMFHNRANERLGIKAEQIPWKTKQSLSINWTLNVSFIQNATIQTKINGFYKIAIYNSFWIQK